MKNFTTIKVLMLLVLFQGIGFAALAQNLVNNGDFETWTAGLPDGWTTIDAGIIVTEETSVVQDGNSSASVNVTTGTQGNTDFRQSISIVAGTEYGVSVWVNHTEGGVRARLYVGTYLQYSDPNIIGTWQEMTYGFTATATEDIEIGLRFYDISGVFDDEEIVYVDTYVIEEVIPGPEQTIYLEGFDSDLGATTQYSVTGAQAWEHTTFGVPGGSAKMSGFDSGTEASAPNEDWLITNSINCSNYINVTLSFWHALNYCDNCNMYVLISTDYDGSSDPSSNGTWTDITDEFIFPPGDNWNFYDAGTYDISAYAGSSTYIAFKYISTDSESATWEVDNIHVQGEPPPDPYITVATPNGGEIIQQGQQYEITWDYDYWDGPIKIDLLKGGTNPVTIVYNIPVSDESYTWNVFTTLATANDYSIRISGIDTGLPIDESDGYFTVIEPWIIPQIIFSEIMYNPPESGNDTLEFLELFNMGDEAVDLEGFFMSQGVEHTFPSVVIEPDTFLLLAKDSLAMFAAFGIESYQWTDGALKNGGEPVELTDKYGNILNTVEYDDSPPWDSLADGYGPSLELLNPALDNTLGENWIASIHFMNVNMDGDSIWATPGFGFSELTAALEADKNMVVMGDSVMFTDLTTGNPTSWMWTFEGGTPETYDGEMPPYITYDSTGKWDVMLVVSDGYKIDSVSYEEYIWVGEMPVADFEAEETKITAGSYTNFMSLSTGDSLVYYWMFDGGTPDTSSAENPMEIYYLVDEWALYDVTLVVSNSFGSDTLTKEEYIEVVPVGLDENLFNEDAISLYPNPTEGNIVLAIPGNVNAEYFIVDIQGRMVHNGVVTGTADINLTNLDNGIYFMKLIDTESQSVVVKRFIIK